MGALREIIAHFGGEFDHEELEHGAKSLEHVVEKVKDLAGALGAGLMIHEIKEFIFGLTEQAEALMQQADAFGMSTKEMQEWQGAANIAGVKTEYLDTAFKILARNVGKGGPAAAALAKLGVATKDASGEIRPVGDLFE